MAFQAERGGFFGCPALLEGDPVFIPAGLPAIDLGRI